MVRREAERLNAFSELIYGCPADPGDGRVFRNMNPPVGEQAVLRLIQSKAATSQIELARALNLRPNTVHGMVKRLEADGLITEDHEVRGSRGRPSRHFSIRLPGNVLVIQPLGTEWKGVVIGAKGDALSDVVTLRSRLVPDLAAARESFLAVRDKSLKAARSRVGDVAGAIVGLNSVRLSEGSLISSSVIPWARDLSEETLGKWLGMPTLLSSPQALAELELRAWTREGIRNLVRFNVGDGVSAHQASLVGSVAMPQNLPGEIGHVQRRAGGEICGCGNRGCLETLISGPRLLRRLQQELDSGIQTSLRESAEKSPAEFFDDLYRIEQAGEDAYARTLANDFLEHAAWGLSVAVNMFQPQVVVLDGYGFVGHPRWLEWLENRLPSLVLAPMGEDIRLEFARQGASELMHELATEFLMQRRGLS